MRDDDPSVRMGCSLRNGCGDYLKMCENILVNRKRNINQPYYPNLYYVRISQRCPERPLLPAYAHTNCDCYMANSSTQPTTFSLLRTEKELARQNAIVEMEPTLFTWMVPRAGREAPFFYKVPLEGHLGRCFAA